jgi:hypothetical protein
MGVTLLVQVDQLLIREVGKALHNFYSFNDKILDRCPIRLKRRSYGIGILAFHFLGYWTSKIEK